ncbi:Alpha/Beta hydrolase protein [Syncephalis plumigaleata]|nr:Alpha/Beta hydrolase protein [Syncephalis plumigaleata]
MSYEHIAFQPTYTPNKGAKLVIDVYLPKVDSSGDTALPPLLIFVHGGAWRVHDEEEYRETAPLIIKRSIEVGTPIAVACIGYRLSEVDRPETRYPRHLEDVASAGHSAGAHLISMLAMVQHKPSSPVLAARLTGLRGLICIAGLYDIPDCVRAHPDTIDFITTAFGSDEQHWETVSSTRIRKTTAIGAATPFLVIHSLEDELVDCEQADRFVQTLKELNYAVQLDMGSMGSHVLMLSSDVLVNHCVAFIQNMEKATSLPPPLPFI